MSDRLALPQWGNWFKRLGKLVAEFGSVQPGDVAKHVVVSTPTGQYATWLIAAGAIDFVPERLQRIEPGIRYVGWSPATTKIDDFTTEIGRRETDLAIVGHPTSSFLRETKLPVVALPDGTPRERSGAGPARDLKRAYRDLLGQTTNWHIRYTQQCVYPTAIIGLGREYLQNQRAELIELADDWFTPLQKLLLSEDSGQTSNPMRMLFHPYMVLTPEAGDRRKWLRQVLPKLVVVTSWTAYENKHVSMFEGSPHIVLANRRVCGSLSASELTESVDRDFDLENQLNHGAPLGLHVRVLNRLVGDDLGDRDEFDPDGDEI